MTFIFHMAIFKRISRYRERRDPARRTMYRAQMMQGTEGLVWRIGKKWTHLDVIFFTALDCVSLVAGTVYFNYKF